MLNTEQGQVLLRLARDAIAARFSLSGSAAAHAAWLDEPGATFVTLTQHGQLRGCIGSLEAHRPLLDDVRHNAIEAAFRDPRFSPLTAEEFKITRVEVSLLSAASQLIFNSEQDALSQLQPGVDGVILEYSWHKATFLPQVWEQLPQPQEFIGHLKAKAGLQPEFWSNDIKLSHYSVQKWGEGE